MRSDTRTRPTGRADATAAIPDIAAPARNIRVPVRFHGRDERGERQDTDLVTVEEPLEIRVGYRRRGERAERSVAVTMRTPGDDLALALGFLLGEGVIAGAQDVERVDFRGPPSLDKGLRNVVEVTLADGVAFDAERLSRHVFTSSSCGVCGKASLDAVRVAAPALRRPPCAVDAAALGGLPAALRDRQREFDRTGGLHASACFDAAGRIHRLREDVGRHNALDKLIGSYLRDGQPAPLAGMGVLLSGRASFELIQKAAMTQAAVVAAIGPPSSLAIELAEDAGIALVGFLKAATFNLYVDPLGALAGALGGDAPAACQPARR